MDATSRGRHHLQPHLPRLGEVLPQRMRWLHCQPSRKRLMSGADDNRRWSCADRGSGPVCCGENSSGGLPTVMVPLALGPGCVSERPCLELIGPLIAWHGTPPSPILRHPAGIVAAMVRAWRMRFHAETRSWRWHRSTKNGSLVVTSLTSTTPGESAFSALKFHPHLASASGRGKEYSVLLWRSHGFAVLRGLAVVAHLRGRCDPDRR